MSTIPHSKLLDTSDLLDTAGLDWNDVKTKAEGPQGTLPLTDEMLRHWPSGDPKGMSRRGAGRRLAGWERGAILTTRPRGAGVRRVGDGPLARADLPAKRNRLTGCEPSQPRLATASTAKRQRAQDARPSTTDRSDEKNLSMVPRTRTAGL